MEFRNQFSQKIDVSLKDFPPTIVQPGLSPSISQMVRTRSVGGNLDEHEMDGIDTDAPFDSEYLDFFDLQDMVQDAAAEREAAETGSPDGEAPPNNSPSSNESNQGIQEGEK